MANSHVTWLIPVWHDWRICAMPHYEVTCLEQLAGLNRSSTEWRIHMWHVPIICNMIREYVAWLALKWRAWKNWQLSTQALLHDSWHNHMWHDSSSDTRCRESPSAWGTEHKKHVHVSFILNNGGHSPVVPILLIARGDGPKKLDSENGNFVLCSKDP